MKKGLSVLILTKHQKHSEQNSVYKLAQAMFRQKEIGFLDVASSSIDENEDFFSGNSSDVLVMKVDGGFSFENTRGKEGWTQKKVNVKDYDFIFLRLPPPLNEAFVTNICSMIGEEKIINNPIAALEYGSKEALLQFPNLCPEIKLIETVEELKQFSSKFPIVLKPFDEHGGKGIVKVENGEVDFGDGNLGTIEEYWDKLIDSNKRMLAMKFLKGVSNGDKRIVVCNGKIILAVLRKSATGKWLCNVAQGGSAETCEITKREEEIVRQVSKKIVSKGIVLYAIDTLEDEGMRYLSEINCTSVGGIAPAEEMYGKDFTSIIAKELVKYMLKSKR